MSDPSTYCPRDHGCSLPAGHDGDCDLTAALCFCTECEAKSVETVHDCPRDGEAVTLCCGRQPFELPSADRLTLDSALVTCASSATSAPPTGQETTQ